jgi:hypothetical protein
VETPASAGFALSGIFCPSQLWIMMAPLYLSLLDRSCVAVIPLQINCQNSAVFEKMDATRNICEDDITVGEATVEMLSHPLQLNTNVEPKMYSKIIKRYSVLVTGEVERVMKQGTRMV